MESRKRPELVRDDSKVRKICNKRECGEKCIPRWPKAPKPCGRWPLAHAPLRHHVEAPSPLPTSRLGTTEASAGSIARVRLRGRKRSHVVGCSSEGIPRRRRLCKSTPLCLGRSASQVYQLDPDAAPERGLSRRRGWHASDPGSRPAFFATSAATPLHGRGKGGVHDGNSYVDEHAHVHEHIT